MKEIWLSKEQIARNKLLDAGEMDGFAGQLRSAMIGSDLTTMRWMAERRAGFMHALSATFKIRNQRVGGLTAPECRRVTAAIDRFARVVEAPGAESPEGVLDWRQSRAETHRVSRSDRVQFCRQDAESYRSVPERCLLDILRRSPLRERTLDDLRPGNAQLRNEPVTAD